MTRFAYSFAFYLAVPLLLLRLLYRSIRAPAYAKRWDERFAFIKLPDDFDNSAKTIWVHAVSVGETLTAIPLVNYLLDYYPKNPIVFTTMTPTGSDRVREIFNGKVFHSYMPYDLPGVMGRFIGKINPGLLIILETELWPNTLNRCQRSGIPTMLINARLSQKSASGYKRFGSATREMLDSLDCIAAQAQPDADRFLELGAHKPKVFVTGSLKIDVNPPELNDESMPEILRQLRDTERPVLIAASTREGEDKKVLAAFKLCLIHEPRLLLILVPRHPERFDNVARMLDDQGLSYIRRSKPTAVSTSIQVLLGDSMGEMWHYFRVSDIAFIGGSLVNTGCHNVLEPAALGIPVLAGPSQFNFETICNQLRNSGAMITVTDPTDLAKQVIDLLDNDDQRMAMGQAGEKFVKSNQGSLERVISLVDSQLKASGLSKKA